MKKVTLILAALLLTLGASAQIKVGASAGVIIPTEGGKVAFGGGLSGEYLVSENLGIALNAGYYTVDEGGISSYTVPLTLGGRYYFSTENIKPYAGVDAGLYIGGRGKIDFGEYTEPASSSSEFGAAPVLGVQFGITESLSVDLNAKYHHVFVKDSKGTIGINVGLVLAF